MGEHAAEEKGTGLGLGSAEPEVQEDTSKWGRANGRKEQSWELGEGTLPSLAMLGRQLMLG